MSPVRRQLGRGQGPRAPRKEDRMRRCDKRFEMRLPAQEKATAEAMALVKGITVSELLRCALRAYANMPEPLTEEDRIAVASLRRRINQIEARTDAVGKTEFVADIAQARGDAQALPAR